MKQNPLTELLSCGQSFWLDNLTRGKLEGGEIRRRIDEQDLRGITSNPAIFHKAISQSDDYDSQIEKCARKGLSPEQIYEAIVVQDIQHACDEMKPVYDSSGGLDGYVSLEVSPHLAHDTEGTIEQARHLNKAVARKNLLIKIPGTPAGVPAIERMLSEGININVTLLFSLKSYEDVAFSYMRALESRLKEGKSLQDVASVASFFVSRIDVLADQLLSHRIIPEERDVRPVKPRELLGRVAVANAKAAHKRLRNMLQSDRWKTLAGKGARPQRLLWASTGTKNPDYNDVMYIEPLIGHNTVSTMPDHTAEAFADHGTVQADTVEQDSDNAVQIIDGLQSLDIRYKCLTYQLMNEGVQKFIDPQDATIKVIEQKSY